MKTKHTFLIWFFTLAHLVNGQTWDAYELSEELKEISGIEVINDTTLVAINDGGNGPYLYVLNKPGRIQYKLKISNATNVDWEDITRDEHHLYIADIGNNSDKRKDLIIYKIRIKDVIDKNEIVPETITFSYNNAVEGEYNEGDKMFDAEAIAFYNDSLWIISKPNPKTWDGTALIYKLPCSPGKYNLTHSGKLFSGPDSWLSDAITGADFCGDSLYVTTYNRVIQFNFAEKALFQVNVWGYKEPSQMESIVINEEGVLILASEKNRILGGGNLYYLRTNVDKHK